MLARSTAWRHGDGRTCTKNTSMSRTWPFCTSRLAGLMSRWASPASQSWRTIFRTLIDHVVVDVGVADLLRPVEELGDQQVLALGCHLDDSVRRCRRDADIAQEAGRVVLVLDEPPDRLERCFVFEPPVEDRPAELVPAVGPHVVHRVELPEQVRVGVALDAQPQRGGAARPFQPDRFDVEHREPELVLHRLPDGLAAPAADVEVRGLAPAVGDREGLVGCEEPERVDRERGREGDSDEDVEGVVRAQVQLRRDEDRHDRRRRAFAIVRGRPATTSPYVIPTTT